MKKAELIFVPALGIGDLVATLEFTKHLIDRDDRILITVLVMKPPNSPFFDAYTKSFTGLQSRIQLIELPEVLYHPDLSLSLSKLQGSLLIFCVSMIDVAKEVRLPSYICLTSNAGFLGLMLYLPTRHDQVGTMFESMDSELLIPGFVNPVPVSVLPLALFNKCGYSSDIELAQRFKDVNGIIVNTFSELEPYAVDLFSGCLNPPVYTVGPVLELKGQPNPALDEDQSQKILKWLDAQRESSVMFLCFGSGGFFGRAQMKEIATGLEQSECKFLWSLRVSSANMEALLHNQSGNDDVFPEGFMERIRGRGMVCGWAPRVEVLAHKAIGGFVSLCGWNSVLESLWCGVQIVTWLLCAEQQLNAFRMVKELGIAVELRLDSMLNGDFVVADG